MTTPIDLLRAGRDIFARNNPDAAIALLEEGGA